jgi:hypothetical protein
MQPTERVSGGAVWQTNKITMARTQKHMLRATGGNPIRRTWCRAAIQSFTSVWKVWFVAPDSRRCIISSWGRDAVCGRERRANSSAVGRTVHKSTTGESSNIPTICAIDLVTADPTHGLSRLAVYRITRDLERPSRSLYTDPYSLHSAACHRQAAAGPPWRGFLVPHWY